MVSEYFHNKKHGFRRFPNKNTWFPKIFNDFGLANDRGVSTFMSGQEEKLIDIIQNSGKENLDIISAGPVPPNPSELLVNT